MTLFSRDEVYMERMRAAPEPVDVAFEFGPFQVVGKMWPASNITVLTPAQHRSLVTPAPPRNAEFLLYCFLSKEDRAGLIGDLMQEYQSEVLPKFGPRRANIWYWSQVMRSIAPLVFNLVTKLRKLGR